MNLPHRLNIHALVLAMFDMYNVNFPGSWLKNVSVTEKKSSWWSFHMVPKTSCSLKIDNYMKTYYYMVKQLSVLVRR